MTTFVLHGGKSSVDCESNNNFFQQFTALVDKNSVNILLCYWSRDRKEWNQLAKRDSTKIRKNTAKLVNITIVEDVQNLFSSLDKFDVFFVAGGSTELLELYYPKLGELGKKLAGKVYIGSSMGTFLVSEQYVLSRNNQKSDEVHKGLGLLPIQTLCHWNAEQKKQEKIQMLKNSSHLPILVLDETKFSTFLLP